MDKVRLRGRVILYIFATTLFGSNCGTLTLQSPIHQLEL